MNNNNNNNSNINNELLSKAEKDTHLAHLDLDEKYSDFFNYYFNEYSDTHLLKSDWDAFNKEVSEKLHICIPSKLS